MQLRLSGVHQCDLRGRHGWYLDGGLPGLQPGTVQSAGPVERRYPPLAKRPPVHRSAGGDRQVRMNHWIDLPQRDFVNKRILLTRTFSRFGKKMYRRKLISREKPQDSEYGTFCHVVFELCGGESQITQGIDTGFGDYYRLMATQEWADYTGTPEYSYKGMHKPNGARSYSPVTPLNEVRTHERLI